VLRVLRQRNFGLLWIGQVISVAGDWVLFMALPFFIYDLTGSTLATGAMFLVETLPRILLSSVAGVFVDRWDRRRTMIAADVLRGAVLLALLTVHTVEQMWIVYLVAAAQAIVAQFFVPAKNAIVPRLVGEADLVAANSLNSLGENVARLVAPAAGGALMAALGLPLMVVLDSASFFFSAAMLALITPAAGAPPAEALAGEAAPRARSAAAAWLNVWREWVAGLGVVRRDRSISGLVVFLSIAMIGEGILDVLLVPFVEGQMAGSSFTLGSFMTAQAAGSILGGAVIGSLGKSISPKRLVVAGALGWGLVDLAIFNARSYWVALVLFLVVGVPVIGMVVSANSWLQRAAPDEYRGRVFGALGTTMALTLSIGEVLGSVLGDRVGVVAMLNVACAVILMAALTAQWRLPGGLEVGGISPTSTHL
jgi:MFS family permease